MKARWQCPHRRVCECAPLNPVLFAPVSLCREAAGLESYGVVLLEIGEILFFLHATTTSMKDFFPFFVVLSLFIAVFVDTSSSMPSPVASPSGNSGGEKSMRLDGGSSGSSTGESSDRSVDMDVSSTSDHAYYMRDYKMQREEANRVLSDINDYYRQPPPPKPWSGNHLESLWKRRADLIRQASPHLREQMRKLARNNDEWELWETGKLPDSPFDLPARGVSIPDHPPDKAETGLQDSNLFFS